MNGKLLCVWWGGDEVQIGVDGKVDAMMEDDARCYGKVGEKREASGEVVGSLVDGGLRIDLTASVSGGKGIAWIECLCVAGWGWLVSVTCKGEREEEEEDIRILDQIFA